MEKEGVTLWIVMKSWTKLLHCSQEVNRREADSANNLARQAYRIRRYTNAIRNRGTTRKEIVSLIK
ncbi:hypothetical protein PNBC_12515 [Paenibacillus crassostreae]|uniref:Uncharacterized protein n=1 Tax=Paenibacillus crassostreae TaxID=1763538 RepID=A0A167DVZ0_9BACL|nr:hypothetical protein LPB68_01440 [Paenibacillus crassostreae]OAB74842.1 hypothetical protein PNBC_12515 [Paenibacillus crassostreae]